MRKKLGSREEICHLCIKVGDADDAGDHDTAHALLAIGGEHAVWTIEPHTLTVLNCW